MSSFGFYAVGAYGSNSRMLDCASTPHMHYYSNEMFHFREWLHFDSYATKTKSTTSAATRRNSSLFSLARKGSHKQVSMSHTSTISIDEQRLTIVVLGDESLGGVTPRGLDTRGWKCVMVTSSLWTRSMHVIKDRDGIAYLPSFLSDPSTIALYHV